MPTAAKRRDPHAKSDRIKASDGLDKKKKDKEVREIWFNPHATELRESQMDLDCDCECQLLRDERVQRELQRIAKVYSQVDTAVEEDTEEGEDEEQEGRKSKGCCGGLGKSKKSAKEKRATSKQRDAKDAAKNHKNSKDVKQAKRSKSRDKSLARTSNNEKRGEGGGQGQVVHLNCRFKTQEEAKRYKELKSIYTTRPRPRQAPSSSSSSKKKEKARKKDKSKVRNEDSCPGDSSDESDDFSGREDRHSKQHKSRKGSQRSRSRGSASSASRISRHSRDERSSSRGGKRDKKSNVGCCGGGKRAKSKETKQQREYEAYRPAHKSSTTSSTKGIYMLPECPFTPEELELLEKLRATYTRDARNNRNNRKSSEPTGQQEDKAATGCCGSKKKKLRPSEDESYHTIYSQYPYDPYRYNVCRCAKNDAKTFKSKYSIGESSSEIFTYDQQSCNPEMCRAYKKQYYANGKISFNTLCDAEKEERIRKFVPRRSKSGVVNGEREREVNADKGQSDTLMYRNRKRKPKGDRVKEAHKNKFIDCACFRRLKEKFQRDKKPKTKTEKIRAATSCTCENGTCRMKGLKETPKEKEIKQAKTERSIETEFGEPRISGERPMIAEDIAEIPSKTWTTSDFSDGDDEGEIERELKVPKTRRNNKSIQTEPSPASSCCSICKRKKSKIQYETAKVEQKPKERLSSCCPMGIKGKSKKVDGTKKKTVESKQRKGSPPHKAKPKTSCCPRRKKVDSNIPAADAAEKPSPMSQSLESMSYGITEEPSTHYQIDEKEETENVEDPHANEEEEDDKIVGPFFTTNIPLNLDYPSKASTIELPEPLSPHAELENEDDFNDKIQEKHEKTSTFVSVDNAIRLDDPEKVSTADMPESVPKKASKFSTSRCPLKRRELAISCCPNRKSYELKETDTSTEKIMKPKNSESRDSVEKFSQTNSQESIERESDKQVDYETEPFLEKGTERKKLVDSKEKLPQTKSPDISEKEPSTQIGVKEQPEKSDVLRRMPSKPASLESAQQKQPKMSSCCPIGKWRAVKQPADKKAHSESRNLEIPTKEPPAKKLILCCPFGLKDKGEIYSDIKKKPPTAPSRARDQQKATKKPSCCPITRKEKVKELDEESVQEKPFKASTSCCAIFKEGIKKPDDSRQTIPETKSLETYDSKQNIPETKNLEQTEKVPFPKEQPSKDAVLENGQPIQPKTSLSCCPIGKKDKLKELDKGSPQRKAPKKYSSCCTIHKKEWEKKVAYSKEKPPESKALETVEKEPSPKQQKWCCHIVKKHRPEKSDISKKKPTTDSEKGQQKQSKMWWYCCPVSKKDKSKELDGKGLRKQPKKEGMKKPGDTAEALSVPSTKKTASCCPISLKDKSEKSSDPTKMPPKSLSCCPLSKRREPKDLSEESLQREAPKKSSSCCPIIKKEEKNKPNDFKGNLSEPLTRSTLSCCPVGKKYKDSKKIPSTDKQQTIDEESSERKPPKTSSPCCPIVKAKIKRPIISKEEVPLAKGPEKVEKEPSSKKKQTKPSFSCCSLGRRHTPKELDEQPIQKKPSKTSSFCCSFVKKEGVKKPAARESSESIRKVEKAKLSSSCCPIVSQKPAKFKVHEKEKKPAQCCPFHKDSEKKATISTPGNLENKSSILCSCCPSYKGNKPEQGKHKDTERQSSMSNKPETLDTAALKTPSEKPPFCSNVFKIKQFKISKDPENKSRHLKAAETPERKSSKIPPCCTCFKVSTCCSNLKMSQGELDVKEKLDDAEKKPPLTKVPSMTSSCCPSFKVSSCCPKPKPQKQLDVKENPEDVEKKPLITKVPSKTSSCCPSFKVPTSCPSFKVPTCCPKPKTSQKELDGREKPEDDKNKPPIAKVPSMTSPCCPSFKVLSCCPKSKKSQKELYVKENPEDAEKKHSITKVPSKTSSCCPSFKVPACCPKSRTSQKELDVKEKPEDAKNKPPITKVPSKTLSCCSSFKVSSCCPKSKKSQKEIDVKETPEGAEKKPQITKVRSKTPPCCTGFIAPSCCLKPRKSQKELDGREKPEDDKNKPPIAKVPKNPEYVEKKPPITKVPSKTLSCCPNFKVSSCCPKPKKSQKKLDVNENPEDAEKKHPITKVPSKTSSCCPSFKVLACCPKSKTSQKELDVKEKPEDAKNKPTVTKVPSKTSSCCPGFKVPACCPKSKSSQKELDVKEKPEDTKNKPTITKVPSKTSSCCPGFKVPACCPKSKSSQKELDVNEKPEDTKNKPTITKVPSKTSSCCPGFKVPACCPKSKKSQKEIDAKKKPEDAKNKPTLTKVPSKTSSCCPSFKVPSCCPKPKKSQKALDVKETPEDAEKKPQITKVRSKTSTCCPGFIAPSCCPKPKSQKELDGKEKPEDDKNKSPITKVPSKTCCPSFKVPTCCPKPKKSQKELDVKETPEDAEKKPQITKVSMAPSCCSVFIAPSCFPKPKKSQKELNVKEKSEDSENKPPTFKRHSSAENKIFNFRSCCPTFKGKKFENTPSRTALCCPSFKKPKEELDVKEKSSAKIASKTSCCPCFKKEKPKEESGYTEKSKDAEKKPLGTNEPPGPEKKLSNTTSCCPSLKGEKPQKVVENKQSRMSLCCPIVKRGKSKAEIGLTGKTKEEKPPSTKDKQIAEREPSKTTPCCPSFEGKKFQKAACSMLPCCLNFKRENTPKEFGVKEREEKDEEKLLNTKVPTISEKKPSKAPLISIGKQEQPQKKIEPTVGNENVRKKLQSSKDTPSPEKKAPENSACCPKLFEKKPFKMSSCCPNLRKDKPRKEFDSTEKLKDAEKKPPIDKVSTSPERKLSKTVACCPNFKEKNRKVLDSPKVTQGTSGQKNIGKDVSKSPTPCCPIGKMSEKPKDSEKSPSKTLCCPIVKKDKPQKEIAPKEMSKDTVKKPFSPREPALKTTSCCASFRLTERTGKGLDSKETPTGTEKRISSTKKEDQLEKKRFKLPSCCQSFRKEKRERRADPIEKPLKTKTQKNIENDAIKSRTSCCPLGLSYDSEKLKDSEKKPPMAKKPEKRERKEKNVDMAENSASQRPTSCCPVVKKQRSKEDSENKVSKLEKSDNPTRRPSKTTSCCPFAKSEKSKNNIDSKQDPNGLGKKPFITEKQQNSEETPSKKEKSQKEVDSTRIRDRSKQKESEKKFRKGNEALRVEKKASKVSTCCPSFKKSQRLIEPIEKPQDSKRKHSIPQKSESLDKSRKGTRKKPEKKISKTSMGCPTFQKEMERLQQIFNTKVGEEKRLKKEFSDRETSADTKNSGNKEATQKPTSCCPSCINTKVFEDSEKAPSIVKRADSSERKPPKISSCCPSLKAEKCKTSTCCAIVKKKTPKEPDSMEKLGDAKKKAAVTKAPSSLEKEPTKLSTCCPIVRKKISQVLEHKEPEVLREKPTKVRSQKVLDPEENFMSNKNGESGEKKTTNNQASCCPMKLKNSEKPKDSEKKPLTVKKPVSLAEKSPTAWSCCPIVKKKKSHIDDREKSGISEDLKKAPVRRNEDKGQDKSADNQPLCMPLACCAVRRNDKSKIVNDFKEKPEKSEKPPQRKSFQRNTVSRINERKPSMSTKRPPASPAGALQMKPEEAPRKSEERLKSLLCACCKSSDEGDESDDNTTATQLRKRAPKKEEQKKMTPKIRVRKRMKMSEKRRKGNTDEDPYKRKSPNISYCDTLYNELENMVSQRYQYQAFLRQIKAYRQAVEEAEVVTPKSSRKTKKPKETKEDERIRKKEMKFARDVKTRISRENSRSRERNRERQPKKQNSGTEETVSTSVKPPTPTSPPPPFAPCYATSDSEIKQVYVPEYVLGKPRTRGVSMAQARQIKYTVILSSNAKKKCYKDPDKAPNSNHFYGYGLDCQN